MAALVVCSLILMSTMAGVLSGAVLLMRTFYRQALRDRDRLLDERERVIEEQGARLVDAWRETDEKESRIATLEVANERLQQLAIDATGGWKAAVIAERARTV
jgi:hypothetical protein